jgi:hypothetical protein
MTEAEVGELPDAARITLQRLRRAVQNNPPPDAGDSV